MGNQFAPCQGFSPKRCPLSDEESYGRLHAIQCQEFASCLCDGQACQKLEAAACDCRNSPEVLVVDRKQHWTDTVEKEDDVWASPGAGTGGVPSWEAHEQEVKKQQSWQDAEMGASKEAHGQDQQLTNANASPTSTQPTGHAAEAPGAPVPQQEAEEEEVPITMTVTVPPRLDTTSSSIIKFLAPDGMEMSASVPAGVKPGEAFSLRIKDAVTLQPCAVVCPKGKRGGDMMSFKTPRGLSRTVRIPTDVIAGKTFVAWTCLAPPIARISSQELQPWVEAAREFMMNSDFEVSADLLGPPLDFDHLLGLVESQSSNSASHAAITDKIAMSRILSNLDLPVMPTGVSLQDAVPADFAQKQLSSTSPSPSLGLQLEHFFKRELCKPDAHDWILKPSFPESGAGLIVLKAGVVKNMDHAAEYALKVDEKLRQILVERAARNPAEAAKRGPSYAGLATGTASSSSSSSSFLRPGFLVQRKYSPEEGFKGPLELRVLTLWGKTRAGTWRNHSADAKMGLWLVRRQSTTERLKPAADVAWQVIRELEAETPTIQRAAQLLQEHMPVAAIIAEHLATVLGAPILHVDFFIGHSQWGLRINKVRCNPKNTEYRRCEPGVEYLFDDRPAIAQILQRGLATAQAGERYPAKRFLQKVGAEGHNASTMHVVDLPPEEKMSAPKCAVSPCAAPLDAGDDQYQQHTDSGAQMFPTASMRLHHVSDYV
mmetsp:Transcript_64040/g.152723  ORF Transcript_64040/g.152723 Transcript_64040/m.152723 type:complete len:713 (-) Transcript_64040:120-2258(-)